MVGKPAHLKNNVTGLSTVNATAEGLLNEDEQYELSKIPHLLDKLIVALKKNMFPQSTEALCMYREDGTIEGFCCLGVLTYLHDPNHNSLLRTHVPGNLYSEGAFIPNDVMAQIRKEERWADLEDLAVSDDLVVDCHMESDKFVWDTASKWNDRLRSFIEIGLALEKFYRTDDNRQPVRNRNP